MGGPESSCFDGIGLGSLRVDAAHLQEQHRRDSSLEKPRAPETAISEAHEIERDASVSPQFRSSHGTRQGVKRELRFSQREGFARRYQPSW